ncbi:hypothetical protein CBM2586_B130490 [Cupriavidus phytorum]|uniref:Uncharacterized protein n=1 Tax=Cupriavidus taiwanensis TaxID=164546 RepID=A0A975XI90_9BURK|nr:hypothetical protein CBM2586_B130490 [Cupriavidus taiwanensis]
MVPQGVRRPTGKHPLSYWPALGSAPPENSFDRLLAAWTAIHPQDEVILCWRGDDLKAKGDPADCAAAQHLRGHAPLSRSLPLACAPTRRPK